MARHLKVDHDMAERGVQPSYARRVISNDSQHKSQSMRMDFSSCENFRPTTYLSLSSSGQTLIVVMII